jgi:hypothetical protein
MKLRFVASGLDARASPSIGEYGRHAGGLLPAVAEAELESARCQPGMTRTKSAIIQMNSQSPATGRESL